MVLRKSVQQHEKLEMNDDVRLHDVFIFHNFEPRKVTMAPEPLYYMYRLLILRFILLFVSSLLSDRQLGNFLSFVAWDAALIKSERDAILSLPCRL